jgi:hypothetical protein
VVVVVVVVVVAGVVVVVVVLLVVVAVATVATAVAAPSSIPVRLAGHAVDESEAVLPEPAARNQSGGAIPMWDVIPSVAVRRGTAAPPAG